MRLLEDDNDTFTCILVERKELSEISKTLMNQIKELQNENKIKEENLQSQWKIVESLKNEIKGCKKKREKK